MISKGALNIDKVAHELMQFHPGGYGTTVIRHYTVFYHENRLYSVRNNLTNILCLVYAANPIDAVNKVSTSFMEG